MVAETPRGGAHRRRPSLRGIVLTRVVNGVEVTGKWPKKRGKNLHPKTKAQMEFFRQAQWAFKFSDPTVQRTYTEAVKGTPLMPRDLFLMCAAGRFCLFVTPDGRKHYPMAGVRNVSESLDWIAQLPGQMIYRAQDRWEPIEAGSPGQVLVSGGELEAPFWSNSLPDIEAQLATKLTFGPWGTNPDFYRVTPPQGLVAQNPVTGATVQLYTGDASGIGQFSVSNEDFSVYTFIGGTLNGAGRMEIDTSHSWDFDLPIFVDGSEVWNSGNLSFGTGLSYDAGTGELTATGGGGGGTPWDYAPPTAASMALQSGDATQLTIADDADVGLLCSYGAPAAAVRFRTAYRTLTTKALDFDFRVKLRRCHENRNFRSEGLIIVDSTTSKCATFELRNDQGLCVLTYTDLAGSGGTLRYGSQLQPGVVCEWQRITQVGSTYSFQISADGKLWKEVYSMTAASFLSNHADRVGVAGMALNAGGPELGFSVPYLALTGPAV